MWRPFCSGLIDKTYSLVNTFLKNLYKPKNKNTKVVLQWPEFILQNGVPKQFVLVLTPSLITTWITSFSRFGHIEKMTPYAKVVVLKICNLTTQ